MRACSSRKGNLNKNKMVIWYSYECNEYINSTILSKSQTHTQSLEHAYKAIRIKLWL